MIGIALDAKPSEETGIVKTLCFVGLNAMSKQGTNYKELFKRAVEVRQRSGSSRDDFYRACPFARALSGVMPYEQTVIRTDSRISIFSQ